VFLFFGPGVTSIDLPIIASVAGLPGNVLASTITLLASAVPGIDSVSNGAATIGGSDPETDAAFRFDLLTSSPQGPARPSMQLGMQYLSLDLIELCHSRKRRCDGNPRLGNMLIIVDDGSALLSDALLASLSIAIGEVRPVGTSFSIQPPQVIPFRSAYPWKSP